MSQPLGNIPGSADSQTDPSAAPVDAPPVQTQPKSSTRQRFKLPQGNVSRAVPASPEYQSTLPTRQGTALDVAAAAVGEFAQPDETDPSSQPQPSEASTLSRETYVSSSTPGRTGTTSRTFKFTDLKLGAAVGRGAYGTVYIATHTPSSKRFAVKVIARDQQYIENEGEWIRHCQTVRRKEPHLVMALGAYASEDGQSVNIVMEYMDRGSLHTLAGIANTRHAAHGIERVPETAVVGLLLQTILGLRSLSAGNMSHRDLKPHNILLSRDGTVKLADFGSIGTTQSGELLKTYLGTQLYMAPERLLGHPYDGRPADVWSAMCVMRELILGRYCFSGVSKAPSPIHLIKALETPDALPPDTAAHLVALLDTMSMRSPLHRPTASDMLFSDALISHFPTLAAAAAAGHVIAAHAAAIRADTTGTVPRVCVVHISGGTPPQPSATGAPPSSSSSSASRSPAVAVGPPTGIAPAAVGTAAAVATTDARTEGAAVAPVGGAGEVLFGSFGAGAAPAVAAAAVAAGAGAPVGGAATTATAETGAATTATADTGAATAPVPAPAADGGVHVIHVELTDAAVCYILDGAGAAPRRSQAVTPPAQSDAPGAAAPSAGVGAAVSGSGSVSDGVCSPPNAGDDLPASLPFPSARFDAHVRAALWYEKSALLPLFDEADAAARRLVKPWIEGLCMWQRANPSVAHVVAKE